MTREQWLDVAERAGATGAEAALGVLITQLSHLPTWWAVALLPVLAAAKGWLASRFTGSAALRRSRAPESNTAPPPAA